MKRKYGWIPDIPDYRDFYFSAPVRKLPTVVDLSNIIHQVWDQENLGSCTAQATSAQVWAVDSTKPYEPSRLFVYYATRQLEGTVGYDSGASIRNSIKSVVKFGFPRETSWPYIISKFANKPPINVWRSAARQKVLEYARVNQTAQSIQTVLAAGFTVNLGIMVYNSFEQPGGIVPMPDWNDSALGGHAILLVGYNRQTSLYKFLNSWGRNWGDNGFGYLPFNYVHSSDLTADLWTIREVK